MLIRLNGLRNRLNGLRNRLNAFDDRFLSVCFPFFQTVKWISVSVRFPKSGHKCAFCQNEHYSASFNVVREIGQRRNILERDKRCLNCLRFGHNAKECQNPKTCRHCQERYHQSICSLLDQPRPKPRDVPTEETKITMTTVGSKAKGTVLLQTAKAIAISGVTSETASVRILLDTESQHTYTTNRLKSK